MRGTVAKARTVIGHASTDFGPKLIIRGTPLDKPDEASADVGLAPTNPPISTGRRG